MIRYAAAALATAAAREATVRAEALLDFCEWITAECPHDADEHAEGTCELCDWTFAIEGELQDRADRTEAGS